MTEEKIKIEIEIPKELYNRFEELIKGHYANRSEAIRDGIRLIVNRLEKKKSERKLCPFNATLYCDERCPLYREDTATCIFVKIEEDLKEIGKGLAWILRVPR